jgi:hypothetical protein
MVRTGLPVGLGVDGVALAELDLLRLLQGVELPPNELIIEGVHLGRDEGAAPVNKQTEVLQVLHALRGEELEPVAGVLELGDLLLTNSDLLKDLELGGPLGGGRALGLPGLDLPLESAGGGMDGHARAVEGEGEEHVLALLALEAHLVLALRHRVGMTYI